MLGFHRSAGMFVFMALQEIKRNGRHVRHSQKQEVLQRLNYWFSFPKSIFLNNIGVIASPISEKSSWATLVKGLQWWQSK